MRGVVDGWTPTVPRGELQAYNTFLRHCGPSATYVGDCKGVVDAATHGVPRKWASSHNINADLWRETLRLQRDHGALPKAEKIKAHRNQAEAGREGGEEGLEQWRGNYVADEQAKSLAKQLAEQGGREKEREAHRRGVMEVIRRVAIGAAWQLKHGAAANEDKKKKGKKSQRARGAEGEGSEDPGRRHEVRPRQQGGWECLRCRGFAVSKSGIKALWKRPCCEVVVEQIHRTHMMASLRGILWCRRCGCFTSRWPRELRLECHGRPASVAQANVRRRLEQGLAPTTAIYLEDAMEPRRAVNRERDKDTTRSSSTPVGRYLRLPGGPLARRPAAVAAAPSPAQDAAHDGGFDAGHGDDGGNSGDHGITSNARGGYRGINCVRGDPGDAAAACRPFPAAVAAAELEPAARRLDQDAGEEGSILPACAEQEGARSLAGSTALIAANVPAGGVQSNPAVNEREARLVTAVVPRRRIRGKSSPPSIAAPPAIRSSSWCSPSASAGWSRRLHGHQSAGKARCHACGTLTSLKCRGCNLRLCLSCAGQAKWCIAERSIDEAN